MYMTNEEICRDYRQAKNQKEQIKILADLNGVSRDKIEDILEAGGVKMKRKKRPDTEWSPVLVSDLQRMYEAGEPVSEIAERIGLDYHVVYDKLKALGVLRKRNNNSGGAAKVQQKEPESGKVDADERYICQLEELLSQKTEKCNEYHSAVEALMRENKEPTDEVKKLRERCQKYVEEIDADRDWELQSVLVNLVGLVDCVRGINTDNMKEADNTEYLFEVIGTLFDALWAKLPRIKKDTASISGGIDAASAT